MKKLLLLFLAFAVYISSFCQVTNETFTTGAFIINMGSTNPQTINNGLKPYGLIYDLIRNYSVPVKWVISQSKSKDGSDFTYNSTSYKGGTFVIPFEYRSTAVNARITYWTGQGVVGTTTTSAVTLGVFKTITSVPRWSLDVTNGAIAEGYLLNAGINNTSFPNAYNWKNPSDLASCDDLFVLPHAEPTWATHSNLYTWNRTYKGAIYASCHAVSVLESLYNPSNHNQKMNFLSKTGLVLYTDHNDGTPPYTHRLPSDPVAQYMGTTDAAMTYGSETIFVPQTKWRSTTNIIAYDPSQSDVPVVNSDLSNAASVMLYGRAWGDSTSNCGWVMYEAGHSANLGTTGDVAAQRGFFDFSFFVATDKSPTVTPITGITANSSIRGGQTSSLSVTATMGASNSPIASYQWTVSINGGTATTTGFSAPTAASTNLTLPAVSVNTPVIVNVTVTDICGRAVFTTLSFTLNPVTISGNVWDDANASVTVDGTEAGTNAGGLYAILANSSNIVVAVTPVNADGTYSLTAAENATYNIILSSSSATVGNTAPSPSLPSNWVNTGENQNGTIKTTNLGKIPITVALADISNENFGIEQLPNSDVKSYTLATYPRLNTSITLNGTGSVPGKLTGTDPEDGTLQDGKTVVITTIPSNAQLYYNGTLVTNGYTITNYNSALLSVKFNTLGATSVVFNYAYVDAAGKQDPTPATYTISWTTAIPNPINISGKVWDDADGSVTINGTEAGTNAGGLYAILASTSSTTVAVATVAANGTYTFSTIDPNTGYKIIVATTIATVGNPAPSPSLPSNWVNTGQNQNGTIQTTTPGIITIAGTASDVTNENFGIEQLPNSDIKSYTLSTYPRLNTSITLNGTGSVPGKLTGTDPEDGTLQDGKNVIITTIPANAQLYYNGTLVTNGYTITNYNSALLTVKFTTVGATSVVFNYAYVDAASKQDPTPATYTISWATAIPNPINISGKVWDDADGSITINGIEAGTNAGVLRAILANTASNTTVAVATVAANGTYSFSNIDPNTGYKLILSTSSAVVGNAPPAASLPSNWVNTGENMNGTTKTTSPGVITLAATSTDVVNENFGIEQLPNSDDKSYTLASSPSLNSTLVLNGTGSNPGKLTGTDPEDGTLQDGKTVIISTVPANGELYYNGVLLTNGYVINNYNSALLSVKFTQTGVTYVTFNYAYVDAAGKPDPNPATYIISWGTATFLPINISGTVWDDANASVTVDGTEAGTNAGGLYAILADNSNNVVAVAPVNANGTYTFSTIVPNTAYSIILSTSSATVGNAAPSPSLPANWVNTGENVNGVIKTNPLGKIIFSAGLTDILNQNFGIEQLPNSDNKNYSLPTYPRLNTTITLNGTGLVPGKLTGTDPEDGTLQDGQTLVITTVPTNAQLYYNGTLVNSGDVINNYDPSLLTLKFTTVGATSVVFNYAYVDAADMQDPTPGTYTITWSPAIPQPINISGKVWDDANGNAVMAGTETVTNAGGLYAVLANTSSNTVAVANVNSDGTYSFSNIDPNMTYEVILTTATSQIGNAAPSPSLPANWVNTGQNLNGTVQTTSLGIITIAPTFSDVINQNFGIEQLPNSDDKSYTLPTYPRLNTSIALNGTGSNPGKLTGTDPEDGIMQDGKTVVITTVPTNAQLYYSGMPVTNGYVIANYDPTQLRIKFTTVGSNSVSFNYAYVDAAGKQDPTPATYIISWSPDIPQPITISGKIWDDANGSITMDGSEAVTNAGGLYVILADSANNVININPVFADGLYSFTNIDPNHTYQVIVSTVTATFGGPAPSSSLPSNWVNTGENMNGITKTTTPGVITLGPTYLDIPNENFGIEQLPNSDDKNYTLATYPRLNTSITLNGTGSVPGKLTGTDPEDGLMQDGKNVAITTIPANAQLYYSGTLMTNGFVITNYDPSLLSVKFTTVGATSVVFNYAYVDAAGKQDPTPGTYTITWATPIPQPINISGTIWDDANGSVTMDGSEITTNAGGLYAVLADVSSNTVAVVPVNGDGTYSFSNIDPNHTYKIIVSTVTSTVGSAAPSPSLPDNWVNTGQNINGTVQTTSLGVITIAPTASDVVNMNFGIEQLPNSDDKGYTLPDYPRLNTSITLNGTGLEPGKLTGSDPEDGPLQEGKTVVITTVPANAQLYYNGTLLTNNSVINNYDPTVLSVKFTTVGATSVVFYYSYVDAAGKIDPTPGIYTITWTTSIPQPITIGGKVWDDANGNVIMAGTETVTNAGGLYAILADSANNVVAIATVGSNGLYSFSNVDPNFNYSVIVATTTSTVGSTAPLPSLPANWVNTGQNINGTIQNTPLGIITIAGTYSNVINQDFGIERLPNSDDKNYTLPDYPRLNTSITLNGTASAPGKLTGTDPEDGLLGTGKTLIITTVPTNAQLYYNGTLLTNNTLITNYDPTLLSVKFTTVGATSVVFNYSYVDAAGKQDPTPGTYTITWTTPTPLPINISGTVWDDANGNVIMAGTETATNAGGLYAILADASNNTVAVATVGSNGTYNFSNVDPNFTYKVIVATTTSTIGSTAPSPSLPANWVNTGQNINGTIQTTSLGIITIAGTFSDVTNQNFGIEQLPNSDDKNYTLPDYPRLNTSITLNGTGSAPGKLTGTDPEDGLLGTGKTLIITTVPINAQLYYNGTLLTNNTSITNYDPSLLSVKFTTVGATSVVFTYSYVDAAGKQDPTPGTYTITWTTSTPQPITISGKVWDDANGSITMDGTEVVTNAGGLYAILADASNNTVAVATVGSNGLYSFSNVDPNFTYKVIVATTTSTIGSTAPSPSLPANWVNTGQNLNGTVQTTSLGVITIAPTYSNVTNMNFGIEQLPNSDDKNYTLPDYPKLNTSLTLNGTGSLPGKLTGTDPEDGLMGTGKTVVITTVPNNAELYYNGTLLTNNTSITNYDPTLLTVKFTTVGATSVVFNYSYVDAASKQDPTPGTYTITWTTPTPQPITISGKVWDDANGSVTINGTEAGTNAGTLYAILADASNNTVAIVPVASDGTYSFTNLDPNSAYKIIVSTSTSTVGSTAPSPSLPANWVNTGENINGTIEAAALGVITLAQTFTDAVNLDFGIEQLPNSTNKSYSLSVSPILNSTLTLNGTGTDPGKLTGTDPEDGIMQEGKTVVITTIPVNAELYYNGVLVANGLVINNYDPSLLTIKFTVTGTTSTNFTYAYVDAAGKQDPTPATYIINWGTSIPQPITVSGNVWDDANGSVTIDGTEAGTNAGGLYAILSDNSNNVIAVSPVSSNGTYSFSNIQPSNDFKITLATGSATIGTIAPSPSLPANWINTGENVNSIINTATLGTISFTSATTDMTVMNFGIEQLPNSDDKLYTLPDYPRLNTSIILNGTGSVPGKLTGTDPEDGMMGTGKTVVITTVPTNAELYYNGTLLTNNFTITNYDPSLLSVKFTTTGVTTVVFDYAYVDAAGRQDLTAGIYTITWTTPIPQPITISGKVWRDANGSVTMDGNESVTNSGGLYAVLATTASNTIAVAEVHNDGLYSFSNIDPNTTYQIILSINSSNTGSAAPAPSLHMNWVNTGENMNGTIKRTLPGIIVVAAGTYSDVINQDFGIEQLPNSDDKSFPIAKPVPNSILVLSNVDSNSGGKLTALDPEDGVLQDGKTVVITTVPNYGELYYNGVLVTNGFVINNYNPSLLSVKFTGSGYSSLMFHYAYVDAAGMQDPTPAFYYLIWPGVLSLQSIDVSAVLQQNNVQVKWAVGGEANINNYVVERSTDGMNFTQVGDVTALNNGQDQVNYVDYDNVANVSGGIIYYRIKQIANDGRIVYSSVVPVYLNRSTIVSVFPTLFRDHYTVNYYTPSATTARLVMVDNTGAMIVSKTLTLNKGANTFTIDQLPALAAGVYNIIIEETGSQDKKVFKMVKQN